VDGPPERHAGEAPGGEAEQLQVGGLDVIWVAFCLGCFLFGLLLDVFGLLLVVLCCFWLGWDIGAVL